MTIYVVIPVYNRKKLTRGCLAGLQQQDMRDFTIIVVDDGSTDGTSEMIQKEFPDTVLLHGDGDLWWVGSINKGIRYALDICQSDDYILSLNDDLVVPPHYLSGLLNAAQTHPGAIIGSVETTMDKPEIIKSGGIQVNWKIAKRKILNRGRCLDEFPKGYTVQVSKLVGRGTLFPSRVFREVGLYDEQHFKQCGDPELPSRANLKFGYQLFVSYDAVVISHCRDREDINNRKHYTLSVWKEYFFGLKSHSNIVDRYWFAHNIAPNGMWFIRYFTFDLLRVIGHFILRLRLRNL